MQSNLLVDSSFNAHFFSFFFHIIWGPLYLDVSHIRSFIWASRNIKKMAHRQISTDGWEGGEGFGESASGFMTSTCVICPTFSVLANYLI